MTTVTETRRARPQAVLSVRGSRWLGAHTVRLTVGGPGFTEFRPNDFTDKYVKIHFVDPALGLVPPYDLAALPDSLPPEQRPVTRTYTVRRVEPDEQQLTLDFVVHGDAGIAAPWGGAGRGRRRAGAVRGRGRLPARPVPGLAPVRRGRVGAAGHRGRAGRAAPGRARDRLPGGVR